MVLDSNPLPVLEPLRGRAPASAPPLARLPYIRASAPAVSAPLTAGISVFQIDGSEPSNSSWNPGATSASCAARVCLMPVSTGVM